MRMLKYEDIARWFTFTIETTSGFPCIRIYDDVLAKLPGPIHPSVIASIRKSLGLNQKDFPFHEAVTEKFGFGDSLKKIGQADGQTTYRLELPIIRQYTGKSCEKCGGTKQDNFGECHYCSGSGLESVIVFDQAYALSASVSLLSNLLWLAQDVERKQAVEKKQLLTLQLVVAREMHGGSLGGDFSPSFINVLKSYGENYSFDVAKQAMLKVYRHMWKSKNPERDGDYEKHSIRAAQSLPGNLMLDVPGDACGTHPSPYVEEIKEDEGGEWTCHNVDTPLQQLTLITGLAAMCDLVG